MHSVIMVYGLMCRVYGLGLRCGGYGLLFRVLGFGFTVSGLLLMVWVYGLV